MIVTHSSGGAVRASAWALHTIVVGGTDMVKFGVRRRSFSSSFAARTRGRATRSMKKALIPGYGKKGRGWLHPKRKLYNMTYTRTTVDSRKLFSKKRVRSSNTARHHKTGSSSMSKKKNHSNGWLIVLIIVAISLLVTYWYIFLAVAVIGGAIGYYFYQKHQHTIAAQAAATEREQREQSQANQIYQFKQLLDAGAITQSEYEQKKTEILGHTDDDPLDY